MKKRLSIVLLLLASSCSLFAQMRLPKVLGSNMVLQAEKPIHVWGWTKANNAIAVTFMATEVKTLADGTGFWKLDLPAQKASFEPREMTIVGDSTIVLKNILIGEVWLCSGQSNMEYLMNLDKRFAKPAKGIDSAAYDITQKFPAIRLFKVDKVLSSPDVTTKGWSEAEGEALEKVSAPGFYFAKQLQKHLNVPIGIISSSWGGSRIEPWTPLDAYQASPVFAKDLQTKPLMIDSIVPSKNYNSMIAPLAPFSIKGFLWYQGESNCMLHETDRYTDKQQVLIESWRQKWNDTSLPFYFVQIAPYYYSKRKDKIKHTNETLPEFWEAQTKSLKVPNTAMIVVSDLVDNLADIHPSYKWEVGRRFASVALARDYGRKNIVYKSPSFQKAKLKKGKVIITFADATVLKTNDGKLPNWFEIAGEDKHYLTAKAVIEGNKVILTNTALSKPQYVRFAWDETAMPNLVNEANLPAIPFRWVNGF